MNVALIPVMMPNVYLRPSLPSHAAVKVGPPPPPPPQKPILRKRVRGGVEGNRPGRTKYYELKDAFFQEVFMLSSGVGGKQRPGFGSGGG